MNLFYTNSQLINYFPNLAKLCHTRQTNQLIIYQENIQQVNSRNSWELKLNRL